ncbi:chemotaxis protein CheB [Ramlibacter pallidus]|uniref:protein-glutamate methylesterase n=1 Tax=Ramlibacter pallidus TaxID=2780087 RepID=A0ABR9RYU6_9BURK|nr:chemotaxis protein CheB [Ramlibacter pallidus]MBE7366002.1 chemotaxis protein CheB [Ramlibacter pallidus]
MRSLPADFAFAADAVAIGASAGGIDALSIILGGLQAPLAAAVVVVLHLPEQHESRLVPLFAHRLAVPVREARPHAPVEPGAVYFAPPGYHLLVEAERSFSLSCDEPVLFSRPSIDVLFESAAEAYGPTLAGIVLTGANEDGARGLAAVKARGGLTAVQDPAEALHTTMPLAAIREADPRFVLPLAGLRSLLHTVAHR